MRLFAAIEPSPELRAWVGETVLGLAPLAPTLRWIAPENAHLTLAFLGEQPEGRLGELREAMEQAAAAREPFFLSFGSVGAFESWRRAHVIWVEVVAGREALASLAMSLRAELDARRFPVEKREFSAHLTVARAREPGPQPALEAARLGPAPPLEVARLSLMRSFLHPKGARYETVYSSPLGRAMP